MGRWGGGGSGAGGYAVGVGDGVFLGGGRAGVVGQGAGGLERAAAQCGGVGGDG